MHKANACSATRATSSAANRSISWCPNVFDSGIQVYLTHSSRVPPRGRIQPGVELMTKPFTDLELAARIRQVLDGDGTRAAS
jgi:hypothetical protein